jgi:hypothetical protein
VQKNGVFQQLARQWLYGRLDPNIFKILNNFNLKLTGAPACGKVEMVKKNNREAAD